MKQTSKEKLADVGFEPEVVGSNPTSAKFNGDYYMLYTGTSPFCIYGI